MATHAPDEIAAWCYMGSIGCNDASDNPLRVCQTLGGACREIPKS